MKIKNISAVNTALILLLLAACSALQPTPTQVAPTESALPATGIKYQLVTDKLLIPTSQAQSQSFALNVDADPQGQPDNKFGDLLTLLVTAAPNLELQPALDRAVTSGQLVSLHQVKADDALNDPSVSWSIFLGQKTQSPPLFDGSDSFTIDSASPASPPIIGSLTNGHFSGGPGTAQIQMFLLNQLATVDLIGVRLEADLSAEGCSNGKMGGGVTVDEFRGKILPTIADGLNKIIKEDPAMAKPLLQAFDSDNDGILTTQELENNPLLMFAITPDLDLLDASGAFNPGQDGVKDSYSVGLGFSCVPAAFTAPAE